MSMHGDHSGRGMPQPPPQFAGPGPQYQYNPHRMPQQPYSRRRFGPSDVRLELADSVNLTTDPYVQQPRQPYSNQGYMPNGAPAGHPNLQPAPGATPLLPNQGRVIQTGPIRLLCIADVRGKLDQR
jgi:hypothetical protein